MSETLLPPNATVAEKSMEMAAARIENVPTPARAMWNPDTCPADLLPWLAWAFSVDTWDTTWTDAQKRDTIKASYQVHRRKGTVGAVRRALVALGIGIQIIEWFHDTPVGDPYTFRVIVDVNQVGANQAQLRKILEVVNTSKNLRSHLVGLNVTVRSDAPTFVAGTTSIGNEIEITFGRSALLNGAWLLDGSHLLNGLNP